MEEEGKQKAEKDKHTWRSWRWSQNHTMDRRRSRANWPAPQMEFNGTGKIAYDYDAVTGMEERENVEQVEEGEQKAKKDKRTFRSWRWKGRRQLKDRRSSSANWHEPQVESWSRGKTAEETDVEIEVEDNEEEETKLVRKENQTGPKMDKRTARSISWREKGEVRGRRRYHGNGQGHWAEPKSLFWGNVKMANEYDEVLPAKKDKRTWRSWRWCRGKRKGRGKTN